MKMKLVLFQTWALMFLPIFISSGYRTDCFSYDYFATTKCVSEPRRAQYGGGMIANPEFTQGADGWTIFGQGAIREGYSMDGNRYIVSHSRKNSTNGVSQKVWLEEGLLYSFSAWIQISHGCEEVAVAFSTPDGALIHGGRVISKNGCWSLLKGGVFANFSGPVDILFENNNTVVDIWIDNVSLKPFTMKEWRSHQEKSIHKNRKSKVKFKVTYDNGTAVEGAKVSIHQTKSSFPFGCGMNHYILTSDAYQNWFVSRFKYTTFTNELKWYSTEQVQGKENYTVPDAMLNFCKQNGISVRGHNIFWDNPMFQPDWVRILSPDELKEAAKRRMDSLVKRYSGELIAWDVMNENMHYRFFEDKLGENASAEYYLRAFQLDPNTVMFLNEFNTIEDSKDEVASPVKYKQKLEDILSYPGNQELFAGIGLQGHFHAEQPNLSYMRSSLDILGSTGIPIWLTEVSVSPSPHQAEYLEQILREAYSHPAVEGIIMFAGPASAGFNDTTLVDKEFHNTLAGDAVDKLTEEWKCRGKNVTTDGKGSFGISLFHGDYNLNLKDPMTHSWTRMKYTVTKDVKRVHVKVNG